MADLLMDYADSQLEGPIFDDPRFVVEVSCPDGRLGATLLFVDHTRFHVELLGAEEEASAFLFDGEGWLTPAAEVLVERVLRERTAPHPPAFQAHLGFEVLYVDSGYGGDEPHFCVSVGLPFPATATVEDALEAFWPYAAEFINIADPGTFDHPYLFSEVLRDMREASWDTQASRT